MLSSYPKREKQRITRNSRPLFTELIIRTKQHSHSRRRSNDDVEKFDRVLSCSSSFQRSRSSCLRWQVLTNTSSHKRHSCRFQADLRQRYDRIWSLDKHSPLIIERCSVWPSLPLSFRVQRSLRYFWLTWGDRNNERSVFFAVWFVKPQREIFYIRLNIDTSPCIRQSEVDWSICPRTRSILPNQYQDRDILQRLILLSRSLHKENIVNTLESHSSVMPIGDQTVTKREALLKQLAVRREQQRLWERVAQWATNDSKKGEPSNLYRQFDLPFTILSPSPRSVKASARSIRSFKC